MMENRVETYFSVESWTEDMKRLNVTGWRYVGHTETRSESSQTLFLIVVYERVKP